MPIDRSLEISKQYVVGPGKPYDDGSYVSVGPESTNTAIIGVLREVAQDLSRGLVCLVFNPFLDQNIEGQMVQVEKDALLEFRLGADINLRPVSKERILRLKKSAKSSYVGFQSD